VGGTCSTHENISNKHKVLVRKAEWNRSFGRLSRGWAVNDKWTLKKYGVCVCVGGEWGWVGVDWIHLNQDRDQWRAVVGTVLNLRAVLNQIVKVDIIHGVSCAELGGATYCDY
jgi:hypothetical protein